MITYKCERCKKLRTVYKTYYEKWEHHFCSRKCANASRPAFYFKCEQCGKERKTVPANYNRVKHHFCSRACSGIYVRNSDNYKRRYINSGGYVDVIRDGKHILEHRLIWEQHHGKIPKNATVHHINGVKTDNRIENLELWESSHLKGVRSKDLDDASAQRLIEKGWLVIRPEHIAESIGL